MPKLRPLTGRLWDGNPSVSVPSRVSSSRESVIYGGQNNGPIRGRMKLSLTNEIAGLIVLWASSLTLRGRSNLNQITYFQGKQCLRMCKQRFKICTRLFDFGSDEDWVHSWIYSEPPQKQTFPSSDNSVAAFQKSPTVWLVQADPNLELPFNTSWKLNQ